MTSCARPQRGSAGNERGRWSARARAARRANPPLSVGRTVHQIHVRGVRRQRGAVAQRARPAAAARLRGLVEQRIENAARLGAQREADALEQRRRPARAECVAVGERRRVGLLHAVLVVVEPHVGGDGEPRDLSGIVRHLRDELGERKRLREYVVQARFDGQRRVKVRGRRARAARHGRGRRRAGRRERAHVLPRWARAAGLRCQRARAVGAKGIGADARRLCGRHGGARRRQQQRDERHARVVSGL